MTGSKKWRDDSSTAVDDYESDDSGSSSSGTGAAEDEVDLIEGGDLEAVEVGTSVCGYSDARGKTFVRAVTSTAPTRLLTGVGKVLTRHGIALVFYEARRDTAGGVSHALAELEFASRPLPKMLLAIATLDLEVELDKARPVPVDSRPLAEALGMRVAAHLQKDVEDEPSPRSRSKTWPGGGNEDQGPVRVGWADAAVVAEAAARGMRLDSFLQEEELSPAVAPAVAEEEEEEEVSGPVTGSKHGWADAAVAAEAAARRVRRVPLLREDVDPEDKRSPAIGPHLGVAPPAGADLGVPAPGGAPARSKRVGWADAAVAAEGAARGRVRAVSLLEAIDVARHRAPAKAADGEESLTRPASPVPPRPGTSMDAP